MARKRTNPFGVPLDEWRQMTPAEKAEVAELAGGASPRKKGGSSRKESGGLGGLRTSRSDRKQVRRSYKKSRLDWNISDPNKPANTGRGAHDRARRVGRAIGGQKFYAPQVSGRSERSNKISHADIFARIGLTRKEVFDLDVLLGPPPEGADLRAEGWEVNKGDRRSKAVSIFEGLTQISLPLQWGNLGGGKIQLATPSVRPQAIWFKDAKGKWKSKLPKKKAASNPRYAMPLQHPRSAYTFGPDPRSAHWTSNPEYSYDQFYRANNNPKFAWLNEQEALRKLEEMTGSWKEALTALAHATSSSHRWGMAQRLWGDRAYEVSFDADQKKSYRVQWLAEMYRDYGLSAQEAKKAEKQDVARLIDGRFQRGLPQHTTYAGLADNNPRYGCAPGCNCVNCSCQTCGAGNGQVCLTNSGRPTRPHKRRSATWARAIYPLATEECDFCQRHGSGACVASGNIDRTSCVNVPSKRNGAKKDVWGTQAAEKRRKGGIACPHCQGLGYHISFNAFQPGTYPCKECAGTGEMAKRNPSAADAKMVPWNTARNAGPFLPEMYPYGQGGRPASYAMSNPAKALTNAQRAFERELKKVGPDFTSWTKAQDTKMRRLHDEMMACEEALLNGWKR